MNLRKNLPVISAVSLVLIVVISIFIAIFFLINLPTHDRYTQHDFIDNSSYQAIFLTNDQIYFGHLKSISSDFLILSDAHYIKVDDKGTGHLIRLGVIEPHAPQDKMIINKDQVLYWENLKPSSQIIKTIKELQSK